MPCKLSYKWHVLFLPIFNPLKVASCACSTEAPQSVVQRLHSPQISLHLVDQTGTYGRRSRARAMGLSKPKKVLCGQRYRQPEIEYNRLAESFLCLFGAREGKGIKREAGGPSQKSSPPPPLCGHLAHLLHRVFLLEEQIWGKTCWWDVYSSPSNSEKIISNKVI